MSTLKSGFISRISSHKRLLALLGLVLATICWGGNSVAARLGVGDIPPVALSFWRWSLAFLILCIFSGKKVYNQRKTVFKYKCQLIILSVFSISAFNTLLYISAQSIQAVNIALIQILLPLVSMLLSIPLLKILPGKYQLIGMSVALPGVLIILSQGSWSALETLNFGKGDMIMLLATCCWGVYTVLFKRFNIPLQGDVLLTLLSGLGVFFLSPFYLWELSIKGGFDVNTKTVMLLAYIIIFASLVAYIAWNFGVSVLGANTASMFNFLIPVFSATFAIPILGETLQIYHWMGGGLIFMGLWVSSRRYSSRVLSK